MSLSGNILKDFILVFWGGVLVSFTPCVYPLIPVIAGVISGANTSGTKGRGFVLSLIYVLGVAVTYSTLGMFAALTGKFFGEIQNNPFVYLAVGNILVIFALVLFDVISLPGFGSHTGGKIKLKNSWGVFLLGISSGFVVSPCTAPVLGSLLVFVGARHNVVYGAALLFVFSYGVGASLILVGTFSGLLGRLPKSGRWLMVVKRASGFLVLAAGEYFIIQAGRLML